MKSGDASEAIRRLAESALDCWGLSGQRLELVMYRENAVFRVETSDKRSAALRVHRPGYHDEAALQSELVWMDYLAKAGLASPSPIADRKGRFVVFQGAEDLTEERAVDMLVWLDGVPLGASRAPLSWRADALIRIFRDLGHAMAELHNLSDQWTPLPGFRRHAWDCDGLVGADPFWGRFWESAALTDAQRELFSAVRDTAKSDLEAFRLAGGDYGLIHADLVRENVLVADDGVKLIDFDDGGFGWRMFDIATALYKNRWEPEYPLIEQSLLEGYRDHRPLGDKELGRLPLFTLLRALTYVGWIATRSDIPGMEGVEARFIEDAVALAQSYLSSKATRAGEA